MDTKHAAVGSGSERSSGQEPAGATFIAPRESAESGRLVFASDAASVSLTGDPTLAALCVAYFDRAVPGVAAQGGIITIDYRDGRTIDRVPDRYAGPVRVWLNGSVPWEVEFHGGISKLAADLRELRLRSLDLASVSQARIVLPEASEAAYIHFGGSASDIVILRPGEVAVQLELNGNGTRLELDGQYFQAVRDGFRWRSRGPVDLASRYRISVSGSVNRFTIAAT